jgi:hypothetical protein
VTAQKTWEQHRRSCWHCQREAKRFEDGDMTCQTGVDLLIAARRETETEPALFEENA